MSSNLISVDSALLSSLIESIDRMFILGQQTPETQETWVKYIQLIQTQAKDVLIAHQSTVMLTPPDYTSPAQETHKTFI